MSSPRCSLLLLSCILLVLLDQFPQAQSRPATEDTDTGKMLCRCRCCEAFCPFRGKYLRVFFLINIVALIIFFKLDETPDLYVVLKTRFHQIITNLSCFYTNRIRSNMAVSCCFRPLRVQTNESDEC